jgi:hypothetical protein
MGITGGRREKGERGVRLGLPAGSKDSGGLHESQTNTARWDGKKKKKKLPDDY